MSLGNVFDIAGSGMNAQSMRLNTTASNIANAESASSSIDETYRARKPFFAVLHKESLNVNKDNEFHSKGSEIGAGVEVKALLKVMRLYNLAFSQIIHWRMKKVMCITQM